MADIDNLSIQISANVESAINSLNRLAEALRAVNEQLDRIDPSRLNNISSAAQNASTALSRAGESATQLSTNLRDVSNQAGNISSIGDATQNMRQAMDDLGTATQDVARTVAEVGNTARNEGGGGFREFANSIGEGIRALSDILGKLSLFGGMSRVIFKALASPVTLASKAMHRFSSSTDTATQTAKKLAKELTRVTKMLKLMVTRMALRAVIKEVGNGFKSLALHSDEFNKSVSGIMNASKQLGYSFAAMVSPLIEQFAPAIVFVINLLIKLTNIINQLFASLSGKSTFNKAKEFTDDWRKSIEDTNKEGKKLKKTVLGFDELNQLQERTTGSDDSKNIKDMFETVAIENKWKKLANYIKRLARKLFDPIKKAWAKVGDFVKKSWKYAMNEILKLGKSIARDFWKVWEQTKTQKIFENILKIIGYIGKAVGNLAKRFREAWDKNDTGLHILENIRDIILIITEYIKKMAKKTAEWADNLDFSPILTKFNEWLESCKPIVDALMGMVSDFYETVILPLAKWAIEEGGPQLLQVFIDFNEKVKWEELRQKLKTLWEHLEPFMEKVGEGLIIFINDCAQALADFLNSQEFEDFLTAVEEWMDKVTPQDVADGLKAICGAILGFALGKAVLTGLSAVAGFINTIKACGGLIKLAIVIGVAWEGYKVGGKLGKWLTDDDELYDEYTLPVTIKWFVDEIPTSLSEFGEKLQEWRDAWHSMMEDSNAFIQTLTTGVDAIMKSPLGSLIDHMIWLKKNDPDAARDISGGVLGTAGGDLGHYINETQEATKGTNELSGAIAGIPTDVLEKMTVSQKNAKTGIKETADEADNAKEKFLTFDTIMRGFIALVGQGTSLVAEMDIYNAISDSFKIRKLEKDLDEGKISIGEFWDAVKGLGGSGQSQGSSILLTRFINEAKVLKDSYDKGAISAQEYQSALSNLNEKYKVVTEKNGSFGNALKNTSEKTKTSTDKINEHKDALDKANTALNNVVQTEPKLSSSLGNIGTSFDGAKNKTTDFGKENTVVWESFDTETAKAADGFADTATVIEKTYSGCVEDLKKQTDEVNKSFTQDSWTFEGVWKGLTNTFEKAEEGIKGVWNRIADKLNGEYEIGSSRFKIDFPKFAGGGFPENGLFLANSTEMVGRFSNGKTAVANNAQIVDGIAAGVYNAVTSAMAKGTNNNGGYIANTIVVDGEVIARTVTRAQERQNMRYSPNMG